MLDFDFEPAILTKRPLVSISPNTKLRPDRLSFLIFAITIERGRIQIDTGDLGQVVDVVKSLDRQIFLRARDNPVPVMLK